MKDDEVLRESKRYLDESRAVGMSVVNLLMSMSVADKNITNAHCVMALGTALVVIAKSLRLPPGEIAELVRDLEVAGIEGRTEAVGIDSALSRLVFCVAKERLGVG